MSESLVRLSMRCFLSMTPLRLSPSDPNLTHHPSNLERSQTTSSDLASSFPVLAMTCYPVIPHRFRTTEQDRTGIVSDVLSCCRVARNLAGLRGILRDCAESRGIVRNLAGLCTSPPLHHHHTTFANIQRLTSPSPSHHHHLTSPSP